MGEKEGFARPELLADPDWLWEQREAPDVRIIDCASSDAYERAHIPGAVALPVDGWLKEPERGVHVMGPEPFADLMRNLGVSKDTTVVSYDDFNTTYATRMWWVLRWTCMWFGRTRPRSTSSSISGVQASAWATA